MIDVIKETRQITQADRVIAKFGGPMKLAKALKKNGTPKSLPTIYKWTYSREAGGTGGIIPSISLYDVTEAAKLVGVELTMEDLDFRPHLYEIQKVKH